MVKEGFQELFDSGKNQKMLDKENIRQWLIEHNFSGEGTPPELSDEIRAHLSEQYMLLYKKLTGQDFKESLGDVKARIVENLKKHDMIGETE